MIKVFIAGGTGWAGSELCKAVYNDKNMLLVGALSRKHSGQDLSELLGLGENPIPIYNDIQSAISEVDFDVLVEYTKPTIAKKNILTALNVSKKVIVGTSGLSEDDYREIESCALNKGTSVLAVGNFALTVVLLQKFSEIAARYIPNFEIIDYTHETKKDAPSGTARELAFKMSKIQEPNEYPSEHEHSEVGSRGAILNKVHIHSIRLPGHVISIESIFGLKDERLSIRHDSGNSSEPYVQGALLAIEKVSSFTGLRRGLDSVMDF